MVKKILLLIVPLIFLIMSFTIRKAEGPHYYNSRYDPAYVYLLSGVNLANGYTVGQRDHPGTPVQLIGAVVIKIVYNYFDKEKKSKLEESVFDNPEKYLEAVDLTIVFIGAFGILLMGLMIYSALGNIVAAVFLQMSPLFCYASFNFYDKTLLIRLTNLSPENLLVFIFAIFIGLIFKYSYDTNLTKKNLFLYTLAFGILFGVALATKIIVLPALLIPFIMIKGILRKVTFLVLALITFLMIFIPTTQNLMLYKDFLIGLALNSGRYGTGPSDVVNFSTYIKNLNTVYLTNQLFFVIFFIIIAALIFFFFVRKKFKNSDNKNELKLLLTIITTILLNIVLISKNFYQHYTFSTLIFVTPLIYLIISIYRQKIQEKISFNKILLLMIVLLSVAIGDNYFKFLSYFYHEREETVKVLKFVENYDPELRIVDVGISDQAVALAFGTYWGASQINNYWGLESKKSSGELLYEPGNEKLRSLGDFYDPYNIERIKERLLKAHKILIIVKQFKGLEPTEAIKKILTNDFHLTDFTINQVFSNDNYECVFELTIKGE